MRRCAYAAGLVLAVACIWFFAERIVEHWPSLRQAASRAEFIPWSLAALLLYMGTFASSTGSWLISLRLVGQKLGFADCARINLLSQFAKFLPGNFSHHVGRVVLARQAGASAKAVAASILIDLLMLVAVGAILSLLNIDALLVVAESYGGLPSTSMLVLVGVCAILAGAAAAYIVLRLVPQLRSRLHLAIMRLRQTHLLGLAGSIAGVFSCNVASFTLGCLSIICLTEAVTGSVETDLLDVLGAYSLAWLAGFILPGAPAGIGVRDAVMLLALRPYVGEEAATAVTAVFRLVTAAGDGLAFLLGLMLPKATQTDRRE